MELRDYLRMLRRGWLTVLLVTALSLTIASSYIAVTPRQYGASTVLFVSTNAPRGVDELEQGANFATDAMVTYAEIIDSSTVLDPVGAELRPQLSTDELAGIVSTTVREETTLIDIAATTSDPATAARIANAVADVSTRLIPTLQTAPNGSPLVGLQQIRPAVEPADAASPDVPRLLAIALVVGLFVGLGGTIVRQTLDTRVRRGEDLAPLSDVPLVAVIPPGAWGGEITARDDPTSATGEAFRTLRTNLGGFAARDPRSLVLAAVSDDRDGAWVAANLAWAISQAGRRALLVDADLRNSTVGELFDIPPGPGLAEVLLGTATGPSTHATDNPLLRVMLPGAYASAPSDLLSTPALSRTLRRLEQEYDMVIVHVPALLPYADAAVVAAASGGAFVTVGAGQTRSDDLVSALDVLANVRVRPLGLVLTGAGRGDKPRRPRTSGAAAPPLVPLTPVELDSPTLRHRPATPHARARHSETGTRPSSGTTNGNGHPSLTFDAPR